MRISNQYHLGYADGDTMAVFPQLPSIREYSVTNTTLDSGEPSINASYTGNYIRKTYEGAMYRYVCCSEYGDYYDFIDSNVQIYITIPTEQYINLNQFNYWWITGSYDPMIYLWYPAMPIIQFRLNNGSSDVIQIKNISITSVHKSLIPIVKSLFLNYAILVNADTDNRTLSLTMETPSDMPQGLQCFYACLPPNDFPANDLIFTITYTRNGVEETVTKTNTKPLQLRHGMKAINIDIA